MLAPSAARTVSFTWKPKWKEMEFSDGKEAFDHYTRADSKEEFITLGKSPYGNYM